MTYVLKTNRLAEAKYGVAIHRYTLEEFQQLIECSAIRQSDPVELIDGLLALNKDAIPPYQIPVGIPPEMLWEGERLLDRRPLRKLTVPEFDRLVENGILRFVRFELAEGWVVDKMSRSPKHDSSLSKIFEVLWKVAPTGFILRNQASITLDESKYEPDITIVSGPADRYEKRHPVASEALLVVEVSHATLRFDRGIKLRSYARNAIENYWIVNLVKDCVEVYSDPSGPTIQPDYGQCIKYARGQKIALYRGKRKMLEIAVNDFLPA